MQQPLLSVRGKCLIAGLQNLTLSHVVSIYIQMTASSMMQPFELNLSTSFLITQSFLFYDAFWVSRALFMFFRMSSVSTQQLRPLSLAW